jgi:hypothetical protein
VERSWTIVIFAVAVAATITVGIFAVYLYGAVTPRTPCNLPTPQIWLRTVSGSGELVFLTEYSTYSPQPFVSELEYELARYVAGDNFSGPGTVFRSGPLSGLNTTGTFQFHDMAAEGEFSPGNDFFILRNPPDATVQLRILNGTGTAIAWNPIQFCI